MSCVKLLFFIALVRSGSSMSLKSPSTTGWGSQPALEVEITAAGTSQAAGFGSSAAEHGASASVDGSPEVHGNLDISTGSGSGINLYSSNYQNAGVNHDDSSHAYQSNYASISGYADDYLYGQGQGLHVGVNSSGWSATDADGQVSQADILEHEVSNSGQGQGWGMGAP